MQPLTALQFKESLPPQGRLLAIDHGQKRIGLAITDMSRRFFNPLDTLNHPKFKVNAQAIAQLVQKESIVGFIIGYPLNMDDTEGPRCQSVRQFARNLEAFITLPTLFWDERLSSDIAEELMANAGIRAAQRSDKVDKLAAAAILQSYMESSYS